MLDKQEVQEAAAAQTRGRCCDVDAFHVVVRRGEGDLEAGASTHLFGAGRVRGEGCHDDHPSAAARTFGFGAQRSTHRRAQADTSLAGGTRRRVIGRAR